jgi:protoporphyrinogen oxidase
MIQRIKKQLTVIGGGITGLSAAYLAARDNWDVTVLEGSNLPGGLMKTFRIGGNRLEHYYHHFFINDLELIWLLGELELADKLEFRKTTMGIFRKNKIYDFNGPKDLLRFTPLGIVDKIRFILTSIYLGKLADWQKWERIAAIDWFYKYAGMSATDSIWRPLLEIKFGPYADRVPTAWMVGRLKQRLNSRRGTEEQLGYIKGSLQTLTDTLIKKLKDMGVKIVLNSRLERLLIRNNSVYGAETANGIYNNGIYLATLPTTSLVSLLRDCAPEYAAELSKIEYFGAVCTILEMDRPLSGIYWLNIADPGFPFGGVIEHTSFIPSDEYNGSHIVYLSRYFAEGDQISSASKKEIITQMIEPLNKITPDFKKSWIKNAYVFRTNTAATVCGINFSKIVPRCKTPIENLYVANMSHIYPDERSCNNAIRVAAQACKKIGFNTEMVPYGPSLSGKIGMD